MPGWSIVDNKEILFDPFTSINEIQAGDSKSEDDWFLWRLPFMIWFFFVIPELQPFFCPTLYELLGKTDDYSEFLVSVYKGVAAELQMNCPQRAIVLERLPAIVEEKRVKLIGKRI